MPFNLELYKDKEIAPAIFPDSARHFWYRFKNGKGAHLIVWAEKLPGGVANNRTLQLPPVDLKGRNCDVGFIGEGEEIANRWHPGMDMRAALKALQTIAEAE